MSTFMDDEIKRWTARRKSTLVLEIIQGKTKRPRRAGTTISTFRDREVGGGWQARHGPAGSSGAIREAAEELQEAYGEAMSELRLRKKLKSLLGEDEK
jgi:hypothetical protein